MTVIMNRYTAMAAVLILLGAKSTMIAVVTPIHISPITLEGMRLRKHQGLGRKRAPAAKGAAQICVVGGGRGRSEY